MIPPIGGGVVSTTPPLLISSPPPTVVINDRPLREVSFFYRMGGGPEFLGVVKGGGGPVAQFLIRIIITPDFFRAFGKTCFFGAPHA